MKTPDLKIRVSAAQREWLDYQSRNSSNRTLNAVVLALIDAATKDDPLRSKMSAVCADDNSSWPNDIETFALTEKARQFARGQEVLYHGTRYRRSILASGKLLFSPVGSPYVSLSRNPEPAAQMATLPRDDDEGSGAILIFDRASLQRRYKLECHNDNWTRDGCPTDEFEERIFERDIEIAPYLIGLIAQPIRHQDREARKRNRARTLTLTEIATNRAIGMSRRE